MKTVFLFVLEIILFIALRAQTRTSETLVAKNGWARNSVNAVVFRKNSLTSFKDTQYIAFYDADQYVVLGKRNPRSSQWQLKRTSFRGNTDDAHNSISIMVDGTGYLHMSWDHHNSQLSYSKSIAPGSLEMSEKMPMTGNNEYLVTYPEFYRVPDGDLLFLYRDGSSGNGNLIINRYNIWNKQWYRLHDKLIDGEGQRNAYWQCCVDEKGIIHLSWVWRETSDVASNHDLCYARSTDGGSTWERSDGSKYELPITAASAEYACRIPQKSELINQTSMYAYDSNLPVIATYWNDSAGTVPQYRIVYKSGSEWKTKSLGFRKTPFSLSGAGTKRIPISRPQVIAWRGEHTIAVALIFRDAERGNKISAAINLNVNANEWNLVDLSEYSVGSWEPSFDIELWKEKKILNLFVQKVEQADGEQVSNMAPQEVKVLEWDPDDQD